MRKVKCSVHLLLLIIILAGCWDQKEVDDVYLPFAIAIDQIEEEKNMIKGIYFAPSFAQKTEDEVVVLKGKGESLGKVEEDIGLKFHHEVNIGHTQVVLIGEKLIKEKNVYPYLDYLGRSSNVSGALNLIVVKGDVDDVFDLELQSTPYISTILNDGVELNYPDRQVPSRTMRDFYNAISQEGIEPSLPYLELEKTKEGKPIGVIFGKIAVLKEGKMMGILEPREAMGYKLLKGNAIQQKISLSHLSYEKVKNEKEGEGFATITILNNRSSIKVQMEEGKPQFKVNMRIRADVIEHDSATKELLFNDQYIEKLEKKFCEEIKIMSKDTIDKLQKEYKSDIVGFGRILKAHFPPYFDEQEWQKEFEKVQIDVNVDLSIRNIGVSL